ncbi:MAG: hypothetical protein FWC16_05825 [Defluviitaleaceae bacterium]|nr:hypothetical protein [Defluviitaleaceae bacterium]MCL2274426.1 hypothetical protein [Defluviitaleaceae bacterium]
MNNLVKYKDPQTAAVMSVGMKALRQALTSFEMELFLVTVKKEQFDYTEWRRDNLWVGMTADEIFEQAAKHFPQKSFGLDE